MINCNRKGCENKKQIQATESLLYIRDSCSMVNQQYIDKIKKNPFRIGGQSVAMDLDDSSEELHYKGDEK